MKHIPLIPLAAATALAVGLACGGDSSGPGGVNRVALLTDTLVQDYDTADYGAEASEMEHTLRAMGVQVTRVDDYDSTSLAAILDDHVAFILPEAFGGWPESLHTNARPILRDWVDSSGGLLIVVIENDNLSLIDSLWGHALLEGATTQTFALNTLGASGTAFAGGPSIVWDNNGTRSVQGAGLPFGSHHVYASGTDVVVAVIPQGRGTIVLLGWDWFNAAPHGSQDGGWIEILRRALRS